MKEIRNLDELLDILSKSISDISFCDDDLKNVHQDFKKKYPDYFSKSVSPKMKGFLINIKKDLIQFRRRTYIRTAFAYIEGVLFAMKRILLENADKLSIEEVIKLQEYKLEGSDKNHLTKKHIFTSIENNLKFTIRLYEKIRIINYKTDLSNYHWEEFCKAIGVRNKITHPKRGKNLIVTRNELNLVKESYNWFHNCLIKLEQKERK